MKRVLAMVLAAAASVPALAQGIESGEPVPLGDWSYGDLYAEGWSVEEFLDGTSAYGPGGEDIGDIEDLIFGPDGRILSVVAEIGGFAGLGARHVSVPWDEVKAGADGLVLPITEENAAEYDYFAHSGLEGSRLYEERIVGQMEDRLAAYRAWRATEVIGDNARMQDEDAFVTYGYVSDIVISDGRIAAVVIDPAAAYGQGFRALPFYGYAALGWEPGSPYYDLPYDRDEIALLDVFDYERFAS